jgi:RNA polymerase sigma factor (sigma-70 family)
MNTTADEFYRAHRADAVRWATALVGSPAIGEDLAQDALLAVSRKLEGIDNPAGYLRRAVVNRCATWHRWHLRERRRVQRTTSGDPHSYTQPTNEMLDALSSLPYRQRAALTLRYWADWTDEQIAESLGCAPATVRVLAHRGITHLRTQLLTEESR